jgi:hypothetical protein
MYKIIFILMIGFLSIINAKTFVITGKVKYAKTDIIFVNYKNIKKEYRNILKNELNMCENIILSSTDRNSFWSLGFNKNLKQFYITDKINKKKNTYSFGNYKDEVSKIHTISSTISKKFKCDNNWLSKKIVTIVKSKEKKKTTLNIIDISGEENKIIYNNKSLLLFPKKFEDKVFFTSIIDTKAYLLELNIKTGAVKKLISHNNGYLVISDIKKKNSFTNILYTTITKNGQIQINEYTVGDIKSYRLSGIYKELQFNKVLLNPKYSKINNSIYFSSQSNNGTYNIYNFNLKNRKLVKFINGLKILEFDLNQNDDIIYKNIYKGKTNYFFYQHMSHKTYRLNTFRGNISKPIFVKEKGFIFSKKNKKGLKNIFYYDIKNQRTIKLNKKYQYFQSFTI